MTETEAIIKKLAGLPCGAATCGAPTDPCSSCKGTGARLHWLRKDCPAYKGMEEHPTSHGCLGCGGKGWVPRLDIPAWEAITHFHEVRVERKQVGWWVCVRLTPTGGGVDADGESPALAFWQAVEKAVST